MQVEHKTTAERLALFSDAVIAVIITIMVLELKAPEENATFSALLPLWPTAVSYLISYLFIAIIWLNHHHLLHFVKYVTPGLIWGNFVHLFFVSLVPFTTAWIARTHLASAPVALYAAVFVCIDLAYCVFERLAFEQADASELPEHVRRMARRRSLITLMIFAAAMLCAMAAPWAGFALICCALFTYLVPELRILHVTDKPQT
ncbi:TMEM175 family protein [Bradyrhizobium sp. SYSU BS000235]|uniref:TMEM175 family protein n=1 Tax=Bradyrhizobium sp. SYSU BS000235 TaxID=3411332 RepID=UPI003C75844B